MLQHAHDIQSSAHVNFVGGHIHRSHILDFGKFRHRTFIVVLKGHNPFFSQ